MLSMPMRYFCKSILIGLPLQKLTNSMDKIKIVLGNSEVKAELFDNETAKEIYNSLPLKGEANLWGEEVYFQTPLNIETDENAREELEIGNLAYWSAGKMFCIFYGTTPVSINQKPRAASKVNVFGKILGNISPLYAVQSNDPVVVEIDKDND